MILITGGSGFLGRHLGSILQDRGMIFVAPSSKQLDLLDLQNCESFCKTLTESEVTNIIHLAAWTQAGDFCLTHRGEQWIHNQLINTNMLYLWKEYFPSAHFSFIGTSCAYGEGLGYEEDKYLKGEPEASLRTYAMTKRMLFEGCQALNHQYGMSFSGFVPATLYGPGYHDDSRQLHFIFDLARKIVEAKKFGNPVTLWGDGSQVRELIHVEDFVDVLLIGIEKRLIDNSIINVTSGDGHSIREFATRLCAIVGLDGHKISYDRDRYVGSQSKVLNAERFRHIYGEYQFVPLDEGLRDIVTEYEQRAAEATRCESR